MQSISPPPITRLGGHLPVKPALFYLAGTRYQESPFLSSVHLSHRLVTTNSIYYKGLTCQEYWYILLVNSNGRYRWGILIRNNRTNFKLQPIDVVADMSGFLAIKMNALEFAQNAKVQTGISPGGRHPLKCQGCFKLELISSEWFCLRQKCESSKLVS